MGGSKLQHARRLEWGDHFSKEAPTPLQVYQALHTERVCQIPATGLNTTGHRYSKAGDRRSSARSEPKLACSASTSDSRARPSSTGIRTRSRRWSCEGEKCCAPMYVRFYVQIVIRRAAPGCFGPIMITHRPAPFLPGHHRRRRGAFPGTAAAGATCSTSRSKGPFRLLGVPLGNFDGET